MRITTVFCEPYFCRRNDKQSLRNRVKVQIAQLVVDTAQVVEIVYTETMQVAGVEVARLK